MRGERVRSKSEVIIADRLLISGIPYKYECPLKVGKRVIHPDFTILRLSDRRVVYYEHCGKLDDPEYAEDLVNRVNDYNHAGIIQGERLFMTFETSKTPLDVRVLDKMIKENFR
jgi:predicted nuclease of restriction endonuclease-like RecB superfamily